jgi:hypothetical protein
VTAPPVQTLPPLDPRAPASPSDALWDGLIDAVALWPACAWGAAEGLRPDLAARCALVAHRITTQRKDPPCLH